MKDFLIVQIAKGQEIRAAIHDFMQAQGLRYAFIAGAVGSAEQMVFSAPDGSVLPIRPVNTPVPGPAEILAFSGEVLPIAQADATLQRLYADDPYELLIHVHAAVATAGAQVYGGALRQGIGFRGITVYMWPIQPPAV